MPWTSIPSVLSPQEVHALLYPSTGSSITRVVPLDVSHVFPPDSPYIQHEKRRLPRSKFFSLVDNAAEHPSGVTIMLPTPERFSATMRSLGIKRDDTVVVYDSAGFWTSPRGAWMLTVYGHPSVAILNGGLPGWQTAGYPVESGPVETVEPSDYPVTQPDHRLIKDFSDMADSSPFGESMVMDSTLALEFLDMSPSARLVIDTRPTDEFTEHGHIPSSLSLSYPSLLTPAPVMSLLPREEYEKKVYEVLGKAIVDKLADAHSTEGCVRPEVVSTCGWGVTATILWLVLGNMGIDVSVFDESWEGWELRPGNPVEKGGVAEKRFLADPTTGVATIQIPVNYDSDLQ